MAVTEFSQTTSTSNADTNGTAAGTERGGRTIASTSCEVAGVCHVSMTLQTGGLERLLVEFGRHHDGSRYAPHFLALAGLGQPADDLRALGRPVMNIADQARGRLSRLKALSDYFRTHDIRVVHSHNTLAHFYAAFAARLAGVPVVINTQHGRGCGSSWKARLQFRMANRLTDHIVAVSEDARRLCQQDDRAAAPRMQAILNGIDVDRFDFRGPSRNPVAISVGRLSPEKDFATLLRATWILIKEWPDFRLRIVGEGRERPALESLSRDLNLTRHVEFLGERRDVPELLSQAGFFVMSSRSEGVPLTVLEAMATGLPIVSSRVGGIPEIVVEDGMGQLVEPGSPEALALGMRKVLQDREAWPVMGVLARQHIERHFNVRDVVRRYEDLYSESLSRRSNKAD